MKFFILTFATLAITSVQAHANPRCSDLSGTYQSTPEEGEKSEVAIAQNDCSSIELNYDVNGQRDTQAFILDGKKRKLIDTADAIWWAAALPSTDGAAIIIENEIIFKNGKSTKSTRRLSLDFTFSPPKVFLLDQRGKFGQDGVFHPQETFSYLKK